jgi:hypothetical protein
MFFLFCKDRVHAGVAIRKRRYQAADSLVTSYEIDTLRSAAFVAGLSTAPVRGK